MTSAGNAAAAGTRAETPKRTWRAWHVFVPNPLLLDRLLVEAVLPEVRSLSAGQSAPEWFFLRYGEQGYHIRFRVLGIGDAEFAEIGERLRAAAAAISAGAESAAGAQAGGAYPPGTAVEIEYRPEYERYGGPHAIVVNEQLFAASSALALRVIAGTVEAPGQRQNVALSVTAATIGAVARDRASAAAFLRMMADFWRGFVPDAAEVEAQARGALETIGREAARLADSILLPSAAVTPPLVHGWRATADRYCAAVRALADDGLLVSPVTRAAPASAADADAALRSMILSQIHMTNNRLGFLPRHELLFAHVLLGALGEPPKR